jgi:hypothetical protein
MVQSDTATARRPGADRPEKRRETRTRVLLTGKIVDDAHGMTADCVIRDRSPNGVRVRLNTEDLAPDAVLIAVTDGVAYSSHVVWRTDTEAGLRIEDEVDISRNPPPHLTRIHRIWLELAQR